MAEPIDPYRMIEEVPWMVSAMVECCTDPGSCQRRVATSVADDIREKIRRYLPQVKADLGRTGE